jgi:hypothetical protein
MPTLYHPGHDNSVYRIATAPGEFNRYDIIDESALNKVYDEQK